MAATALVREVLRRVSVLLQDSVPQFNRWSETELVDWLGDAEMAITKFLPAACSRIDAIKLKPGTLQSIEEIAPADCIQADGTLPVATLRGVQLLRAWCNMGADGQTPGAAIRVIDGDSLDTLDPSWHTVKKTVVRSYFYDPATPLHFHVTPGAHATTPVWARIAWIAQPAKIPNTGTPEAPLYAADGASTLRISLADQYVDDLVNYVVARANMKDTQWADGNKAAAFTNLFTGSLNAKVASLTGSSPNLTRLPFAPDPVGVAK